MNNSAHKLQSRTSRAFRLPDPLGNVGQDDPAVSYREDLVLGNSRHDTTVGHWQFSKQLLVKGVSHVQYQSDPYAPLGIVGLDCPAVPSTTPRENDPDRIQAKGWRSLETQAEEDVKAGSIALEKPSKPIRLLDVMLIVIGCGPETKELVRRRYKGGGRVCLLWTDRPPKLPTSFTCVPDDSSASIQEDFSGLLLRPPRCERKACEPIVKELRSEFKTISRGFCNIGPDITTLLPTQEYEIFRNKSGHFAGVRVFACDATSIVWELSGIVCYLLSPSDAVKPTQLAQAMDVSVESEEFKPFATVDSKCVAVWTVYYFLQLASLFTAMNMYEADLQPKQLPWWRILFGLGMGPFGASIVPLFWGHALVGVCPTPSIQGVCAIAAIAIFSVYCLMPLGKLVDHWNTWPMFSVCVLSTVTYLAITLPVYSIWARFRILSLADRAKRVKWHFHFLWFAWLVLGSLGTWIILYCVALFFIWLSSWNALLAAIVLPMLTLVVELALASATGAVYTYLVYRPRFDPEMTSEMFGDQKMHLISVMCFTHAYAESTRLISLIVDNVINPGYTWILTLCLSLFINIAFRTGNAIPKFAWCMFPVRIVHLLKPSPAKILHNDAKYMFGYPRFVSVLALALSRWCVFGSDKQPLFNLTALATSICALVFEIAEDIFVKYGEQVAALPVHTWRHHLHHLYEDIPPFHPSQMFLIDSKGSVPSQGAIGFHSMRLLPWFDVGGIMAPSCYFSYCLLTLLLGAGFVHDVCPERIPEARQILDGLLWTSPLRCT